MAKHHPCAHLALLCAEPADPDYADILSVFGFPTALLTVDDGGRDAIDGDVKGKTVVLVPPTDAESEAFRARALAALPDGVAGVKALPIPVMHLGVWLRPPGASSDLLAQIDGANYLVPPPDGADTAGVDGHAVETWQPRLTRVSDVAAQVVLWLWPLYIALGKITVMDGDPGLGKSSIAMDLAARVTRNDAMPDGTRGDLGGPGVVILLIAEDGIADTVRPRLEAVGADLDLVVVIEGLVKGDDERSFTLRDGGPLEKALVETGAKVVCFDPLMAHIDAGTNSYNDQAMRAVLTPLARLAERLGVAIVLIRHLNKVVGGNALQRGGGTMGIIGAARSGLMVGRAPDDPEGRRCVLAVSKSNLGAFPPSMAYHIEGTPNGASRVVWEGTSPHSATSLVSVPTGTGERTAKDDAQDVLRALLADGPLPVEEVKGEAKAAGISEATLQRAKTALGIKPKKEGFGKESKWVWALPSEEPSGA